MELVNKHRDSNLELYRIIVMVMIVANHYVTNSGLIPVMNQVPTALKSLYLYFLGMWGKTGIDCFVLITGYYMCQSRITLRKFTKLLLWVLFYNLVIYLLFVGFGYCEFTLGSFLSAAMPIKDVRGDFTSCYFVFFLTIPFLNILVSNMSRRQHFWLLVLCLSVYTIWAQVPYINVSMNYVMWFGVIYLIASYIRLHSDLDQLENKKWGWLTLGAIFVAYLSVLAFIYAGHPELAFYFVTNSNAILAVVVSVCSFMFFKSLPLKYHPWINAAGASTFGVLLIHSNSDAMRQWLWKDTLNNVGHYADNIYLHSIGCILGVFVICIIIDRLRLRFIERPLFKALDRYMPKILNRFPLKWT